MPREVKAYACKYRCGERVNTCKDIIIRHEEWCFKNSQNRACPACKFNEKYYAEDESGRDGYLCSIDKKPDGNITFIKNCPFFKELNNG